MTLMSLCSQFWILHFKGITLNWWTYKVCYKKEITQYHEENGIVHGDVISLGTFHSEKEWNNTSSQSKSKEIKYHYHKYVNGSVCDLVGKKRETTVKFFCNEDMVNAVVSVDEPETCVYTINVQSKSLCTLPLFKPPKKESAKDITCSPALTKHQYDKYLLKEEEKIKKKKEEERLRAAEAEKRKKVLHEETLSDPLGSFVTAFQSFLTTPAQAAKDKSKDGAPKDDLSNFWKDFGIDLSGTIAKPEAKSEEEVKGKEVEKETKTDSKDKTEADEMVEELNPMSKGDGMVSTEGKLFEKKLKKDGSVAELTDEIKKLFSLQEAIDEVDKQAEELIKKDREKRTIFVNHFGKSKQKAEKQITDLRMLLNQLTVKKSSEKGDKNAQHLELMIKKIEQNLRLFQQRIDRLNKKMENSLKRSEAFEKRYKNIQDMFSGGKSSKKNPRTKEEPLVSLNEVLKSLRNERDEVDRIAKSGDELKSPEDTDDVDTEKVVADTSEKESKKQVDPILDAVIKMLKLGGKKEKKAEEASKSESAGSSSEDDLDSKQIKNSLPSEPLSFKEGTDKGDTIGDNKIKVKITHLGSDDVKLLEEDEKQEELAGTNNANNRLRKAGKKIENMVKEKLKKAGVDLGTNIKIKIITNDGPLSSLSSKSKTDFLTDETATQFKDMLVNMLGGGTEKVKEEKRQSSMEDSYKFVWDKDEGTEERTEEKDSKSSLL
eukprot:gene14393-5444_t